MNTCSGTRITVGKDYVFTLRRSRERDETDMYEFVEGAAHGNAAYEVKNSTKLLEYCTSHRAENKAKLSQSYETVNIRGLFTLKS